MDKIIARLAGGKYHYGAILTPESETGRLLEISVDGPGPVPANANNPATLEEHERWLRSLKTSGMNVTVKLLQEPRA